MINREIEAHRTKSTGIELYKLFKKKYKSKKNSLKNEN